MLKLIIFVIGSTILFTYKIEYYLISQMPVNGPYPGRHFQQKADIYIHLN